MYIFVSSQLFMFTSIPLFKSLFWAKNDIFACGLFMTTVLFGKDKMLMKPKRKL